MKIEICDNLTGEIRELELDIPWNRYAWAHGNFSCDCNREDFFRRANKEPECEEASCGGARFGVRYTDENGAVWLHRWHPVAQSGAIVANKGWVLQAVRVSCIRMDVKTNVTFWLRKAEAMRLDALIAPFVGMPLTGQLELRVLGALRDFQLDLLLHNLVFFDAAYVDAAPGIWYRYEA